jgi:hypothetical protein
LRSVDFRVSHIGGMTGPMKQKAFIVLFKRVDKICEVV